MGYSLWDRPESDTTKDDERLRAIKQYQQHKMVGDEAENRIGNGTVLYEN